MRYLKAGLCLILIATLSACSKSQFMDLSGFIHNYNKVSEEKIAFTDFYRDKSGEEKYRLADYPLLLTLIKADDGKIECCRVMTVKTDEKGQVCKDIEERKLKFLRLLESTLMAFCSYDADSAGNIISELRLTDTRTYKTEGELTMKKGSFCFVYYSNALVSEVMIYNTYLREIEPTQKPSVKQNSEAVKSASP